MSYIDVFIPLAIGLLLIFNSESLVKIQDPTYNKKVKLLKKCGFVLLGVAGLYLIIKICS